MTPVPPGSHREPHPQRGPVWTPITPLRGSFFGSSRLLVQAGVTRLCSAPYGLTFLPLLWIELSCFLSPRVPTSLLVQQVLPEANRVIILARSTASTSICPSCSHASGQVHSRYQRTLADLPWQGQIAILRLQVRRFRCGTAVCPRQIFTERLPDVTASRTRKTLRLADIQHHIALALGGKQGSSLAARLAMPVSATTLLDMLRRAVPAVPEQGPRVLGVDDWAWRRSGRYGTILCDLEQRRVVDLLPDRRAETLAAWLRRHPGVAVISRDRAGAYADGARQGAPTAIQVADRWHLLENCSRALLETVRRCRAEVQAAAHVIAANNTATPDEPPPMTSAERQQWGRWQRNRQTYEQVIRLHRAGLSIKAIVRQLPIGRNTVRRWLRGASPELRRPRRNLLEPHRTFLERRWAEGCHNGAQLWRELRQAGFAGGLRVVTEWATRQRLAIHPTRVVSNFTMLASRHIARILAADPQTLNEPERSYSERLCAASPSLARVHDLVVRFASMVRERKSEDLDDWLAEAAESELKSFANGLDQDKAAVKAALSLPWSNGQTEGQITRLKLIKRQMYGRAKFDLLRTRVLQAA
ncbi:MAG TPA: ISL3 family transposase [Acidobacteriaceae bacterium]|nr:ISL3 family transposase [Acidobacteriaceae bacterium]